MHPSILGRLAAIALLASLAAGCTCTGLPTSPFASRLNTADGAVRINGSIFSFIPQRAAVITSMQVWVNYEADQRYSGQRLTRVEVTNSQGITRVVPGTIISYANEIGRKSTGAVELSPYLTRGLNTINVFVTNGVLGNLRLRGIVGAAGKPSGGIVPVCFESDQAPAETQMSPPMTVDYQPTRRR